MRQLRFNYTFPTGYVQKYPSLSPGNLVFPYLYGTTSSSNLNQSNINNLAVAEIQSLPNIIIFSNVNNGYLNILVPCQLGTISSFKVNGVTSTFNLVTSIAPDAQVDPYYLVVNEVDYAFNYYISNVPYTGSNITVEMTFPATPNNTPEPPY